MATTLVSVEEVLGHELSRWRLRIRRREIVQRNVGEIDHGDLQSRRFRVLDVVLVAGPRPAGRIITAPPHVVVEVLSPDDRAAALQD
jgi:Uma2 family endonuclease